MSELYHPEFLLYNGLRKIKQHMKQVIQNIQSGQVSVQEIPAPQPQAGMVQVNNCYSLVSSGTERMVVEFAEKNLLEKARSRPDLVKQVFDKVQRDGIAPAIQTVFNRLNQPMALGYSSAGIITQIGPGMENFQIGQRVACAGAGHAVHAEVITVPENLTVKLPDSVTFEEGAFTTIGAIAMHGFRLAIPQIGETTAIIGLGLLGLMAAQIARAAGCQVLAIEPNPARRQSGEDLGLLCCSPEQAIEYTENLTRGMGADIVLICADTHSNDPIIQAGNIARDRGRVIAIGSVGLDIPRKIYYQKELTFLVSRSYGPGRYDVGYEEKGIDYPPGYVRWTENRNMQAVVTLMANKQIQINPLVSHTFSIEQAAKAYELISNKDHTPYLGVLIEYPAPASDRTKQPTRVLIKEKPAAAKTPAITLGVLGAGNYAKAVFLPLLKNNASMTLHTVVSQSGVNARQAAEKYQFACAGSDENDIFQNHEINTVAVLTRHHLHAQQVLKALQHNQNVYCEKPLALTKQELSDIFSALQNSTGRLTVGFNRRFAPLAVKLKQFFAQTNAPMMISYRINAGPLPASHWTLDPEQGGGRILGEGCHFIDFLSYMVGETPSHIQINYLPPEKDHPADSAHIQLFFPNGSLGSVLYLSNGDKSFAKEYCEVFSGGRIGVLDDFRALLLSKDGKRQSFREKQDKGHAAAWQAFQSGILQSEQPSIPYEHLWAVSLAAILAAQENRNGEAIPIPPFSRQ